MKLVSEIAVTNELRPVAELLRGLRPLSAHQCPLGSHAHIWYIFGPIMPIAKSPKNVQKQAYGILVATGLLNTYADFVGHYSEFGRQIL